MLIADSPSIFVEYKDVGANHQMAEMKKDVEAAALQRLYPQTHFIERTGQAETYWELRCQSCPLAALAEAVTLTQDPVVQLSSDDISGDKNTTVAFETQDDQERVYAWTMSIVPKSPLLVKAGEHVKVVYRNGNLVIQSMGQALSSGHKGDLISIRLDTISNNSNTTKTNTQALLQGLVTRRSEVVYESDF